MLGRHRGVTKDGQYESQDDLVRFSSKFAYMNLRHRVNLVHGHVAALTCPGETLQPRLLFSAFRFDERVSSDRQKSTDYRWPYCHLDWKKVREAPNRAQRDKMFDLMYCAIAV